MEKIILKGYGFAKGNKFLLYRTTAERKTKALCDYFIKAILKDNGKEDDTSYHNEENYKYIRYGLTKIELYDCGSYYSLRFDNGHSNFPKNECDALVEI